MFTRIRKPHMAMALTLGLLGSVRADDPNPGERAKAFYTERYRPQFHFTAREGWLNDPNGCVYFDGEYHLFFQHNPAGVQWGNMTWGHAVSTNLVHWRQLPNAIHPYDGGTIWSGSAVADLQNTSGLGQDGAVALVAAFTHARGPYGQALAFSTDRGRTWTLYEGGKHVVPNQGIRGDERDPKVFWHVPSSRWIMVLWVCHGKARFLSSPDLKNWTHVSDFDGEGFYECPDLFELPVDGDPKNTRWVLTDAGFRYWIGAFDGKQFQAEAGPFKGEWGANFYAAQTWNHTEGRVVQIGWMKGGNYPGMPFNQQMSFPCELTLRTTPNGLRVFRQPVPEIRSLYAEMTEVRETHLKAGEERAIGRPGELFDIAAEIEPPAVGVFGIRVHGVEITYAGGQIRCLGKEAPVTLTGQALDLRILVDRTSLELFANRGEVGMSFCILPSELESTVQCYAKEADANLRALTVHRLRSIWENDRL